MDNDSDLPQLQSIQLGTEAFYGDDSDDRKTMIDQSCTSKNTLTMKSISFILFTIRRSSFLFFLQGII